jgi:hypothetical protein
MIYLLAALMLLATPAAFAQSGYPQFCSYSYATYAYSYDCGNDNNDNPSNGPLHVSLDPNCNGSIITVTEGADVSVLEYGGGGLNLEQIDSSHYKLDPDACGLTVRIYASKNNYEHYEGDPVVVDCGICGPVGCQSDSDCASDKKCNLDSHQCVDFQCQCGQTKSDHECVGEVFQCGGANCPSCPTGQVCDNHQCKQGPECTTDLQCKNTQFCNIPPGLSGGSCKDLCEDGGSQCQCSNTVDHKLVPTGFECDFPGCGSCQPGMQCIDHKCVGADLNCPSTGIVGDEKTCQAVDCKNCDIEVTGPDGKKFTGKTDDNGNFDLPLDLEGIYKVLLLRDGQPVKTVEVKAFPQSQPENPEKPGQPPSDNLNLLWLLLLLLAIILAIVYWRSRGQKK